MSSFRSDDLHGCAPNQSPTVLLLIDVINDIEFPGGEDLVAHALPAVREIAALKERAATAGVPAIYVNDNFGRWRSDFTRQVRHCREDGVRGQPIAELLRPGGCDYFEVIPHALGQLQRFLETKVCPGVMLQFDGHHASTP